MIGASDAGAHLDMIAAFRYSTGFLEEAVRQHQLLPLERAIHLLTGAPARLYGLRDRGVLPEGAHGDIVVFDEDGRLEARRDAVRPAGRRRTALRRGTRHRPRDRQRRRIAAGGAYTGERSGTLLRAGRDSATPTLEL